MFLVEGLRKHWNTKHRMDPDLDKCNSKVTKIKVKKNTKPQEEAVVSSLAIHYADSSINASSAEKRTLYNFGKRLHALFLADPTKPYEEWFPDMRICGRKKLANRLESIASSLLKLLT